MGYTHYFQQTRSFTDGEWSQLMEAVETVYSYCMAKDIELFKKVADDSFIINGVDDNEYEDFYISREKEEGFHFCKTEAEPYDLAVVLILLSINTIAPGAFKITSDGNESEWLEGINAYKDLFGCLPKSPIVLV